MQEPLMSQGLTLMLAGMGTVFVFLTLLVIAMSVLAALLKPSLSAATGATATDEEVAAVSAAITLHRRR